MAAVIGWIMGFWATEWCRRSWLILRLGSEQMELATVSCCCAHGILSKRSWLLLVGTWDHGQVTLTAVTVSQNGFIAISFWAIKVSPLRLKPMVDAAVVLVSFH